MKNEIKCPKCGEVFSVDDVSYAAILNDVRTKEFDSEIARREQEIIRNFDIEKSNYEQKISLEKEKSLQELNNKINELEKNLEVAKTNYNSKTKELENSIELEKEKAVNKIKDELNEKQNKINLLNQEMNSLKEQQLKELKEKDDTIAYFKDLKAKLNNKMVGESLEVHCSNSFDMLRPMFSSNGNKVYFEKDNDASSGAKGDFIYRETTPDDIEIISIMFEMKNQNEDTKKKHKNEDFFAKLDSDRKTKGCEYAVLVSLLEEESELYNNGIVDVGHRYEKMYVIRPQFFIPIITILRNAAFKSLKFKRELEVMKNENIDVTEFSARMEEFKTKFGKNFDQAKNKFDAAIKEIDNSIKALEAVKANLMGCTKKLNEANDKAQDLNIKKLTRGLPLLKSKFEEAEKELLEE